MRSIYHMLKRAEERNILHLHTYTLNAINNNMMRENGFFHFQNSKSEEY